MNPYKEDKRKGLKRPERGPIPMARTIVDLNSDVDVLQRHIGTQNESAATVGDLSLVGLVKRASDGTVVASTKDIAGSSNLNNFLKGYE